MTKAEQAALAEMKTTPERIAERQEHISQLLNGEARPTSWPEPRLLTDEQLAQFNGKGEKLKASVALVHPISDLAAEFEAIKPTRRPRKDKGIPRQKAPAIAQQSGFLSSLQVLRLRDLIDTRETRRIELEAAKDNVANREGALDAADTELDDFLNELQGKGK